MRIKWKKYLYGFFLVVLFPLLPFRRLFDRLTVTEYTVRSSKLPPAFDGFCFAQISDLHNKRFGKDHESLYAAVKSVAPDVVAITGDLIDANRTNVEAAKKAVRAVSAIAPVYYVTGNHESKSEEYPVLESELKKIGVFLSDDKSVLLKKEGASIQLSGLREYKFTMKKMPRDIRNERLNEKLQVLKGEDDLFSVLLTHRPELFDLYAKNGFDLILCGHAHGGQIRFKNKGLIAPDQGFFPQYTAGIYEKENSRMIVGRGLGNSAFPFRINNPPEITVIRLKRE